MFAKAPSLLADAEKVDTFVFYWLMGYCEFIAQASELGKCCGYFPRYPGSEN